MGTSQAAKRSSLPSAFKSPLEVTHANWAGGWNSVRQGQGLDADQLSDILNLRYVSGPRGVALWPRVGLKRQTSAAPLGEAIKDLWFYVDSSGTTHDMAVGNSDLHKLTAGALVKVADLESTRGRFTQFGNWGVVYDGSYLKQYDGTDLEYCWDSGGYLLSSIAGHASGADLDDTLDRAGHKFTTPDWGLAAFTLPVETATFWLSKTGTPTGTCVCKIRKVSDDSVVATSDTKTADDTETAGRLETFTFSAGSLEPNTAYYCHAEYTDGDASNYISVHYTTDTAASGNMATYNGAAWSDISGDCCCALSPGLPPKSSFGGTIGNRLVANDEGVTNRARHCQVNDINDWSGIGAGWLDHIMGGVEITAIAPFFKALCLHTSGDGPRTVTLLTGTSPTTWGMERILNGAGAINQDCVHSVGNDQLFLDDAGLVSLSAAQNFGNVKKGVKSDDIEDLVLPAVANTRLAGVCRAHQQLWLDIGGTYLVVYDASREIWTKYEFEISVVHDQDIDGASFYDSGTVWTDAAATFGITDTGCDIETLFETLAGDSAYLLTVKDDAGVTTTGYVRGVAASGGNYTITIDTDTDGGGDQDWTQEAGFDEGQADYNWAISAVADVTITAFGEKDGELYVGTSEGHVYKYDVKDPLYHDASVEYDARVRGRMDDIGFKNFKRLRYANTESQAPLGAQYNIKIYREVGGSAVKTIPVTLPASPDLLVADATMTVEDALFALSSSASNWKLHRCNLHGQGFMVGIEDINLNNGPLLISAMRLEAAAMANRFW